MHKLILAPVGRQVPAVLAPLLTEPLKPCDGDEILIIESDHRPIKGAAKKIFDYMSFIKHPGVFSLISLKGALERIEKSEKEEMWLLANGGEKRSVYQLFDVILEKGKNYSVLVSRDFIMNKIDSSGRVQFVKVNDLGLDNLLSILDTEWCKQSGKLNTPFGLFQHVSDVYEKSGFLFVSFDSGVFKPGNELREYRNVVLMHNRLIRACSLDKRRIFLKTSGEYGGSLGGYEGTLRFRAKYDGVLIERKGFNAKDWEKSIAMGECFSLPDDVKSGADRPLSQKRIKGTWNNSPLVVIMGPEASNTLSAIWSHKPGECVVLYDRRNPEAVGNTNKLLNDRKIECAMIYTIALPDRDCDNISLNRVLEKWSDKEVEVNMTPGDKFYQIALQLWIHQKPCKRRGYLFSKGYSKKLISVSGPGREVISQPAPLKTVLTMKARKNISFDGPRFGRFNKPNKELDTIARGTVMWIAKQKSIRGSKLHRMWLRNSPPNIELNTSDRKKSSLHVPNINGGKNTYILEDLAFNKEYSTFPKSFLVFNDEEVNIPRGEWFEWLVADLLFHAGIEEVQTGVFFDLVEKSNRSYFDEQLDILTRQSGKTAYWSIKLGDFELESKFWETRAQATHLIARASQAILLVARINSNGNQLFAGMKKRSEGHWRDPKYGDVLDVRAMMNEKGGLKSGKLREIASFKPEII